MNFIQQFALCGMSSPSTTGIRAHLPPPQRIKKIQICLFAKQMNHNSWGSIFPPSLLAAEPAEREHPYSFSYLWNHYQQMKEQQAHKTVGGNEAWCIMTVTHWPSLSVGAGGRKNLPPTSWNHWRASYKHNIKIVCFNISCKFSSYLKHSKDLLQGFAN